MHKTDPCRVAPAPARLLSEKNIYAVNAQAEAADVMRQFEVTAKGLTRGEVRRRLRQYGPNETVEEKRISWWSKLLSYFKDPLLLLLVSLGLISFFTGDAKAAAIIGVMLCLSVLLRFFQERRADAAAVKLKALVHTTATVLREGRKIEIPLRQIVPGDLVLLSAGDLVPADVRLVVSKDLFIDQTALTGESLPAEKHAEPTETKNLSQFEYQNLCFMGTNVSSGTATALVISTGAATAFGSLAAGLKGRDKAATSFDRGVQRFTWLMVRFMLIMVPAVFLINGIGKGDWFEAFLFAVAVAVGLTPELLPMIVTVNLSKAALDMSKRKVIVKRLNAIQDFGAIDILCTDKTGTLTQGRVALVKHVDIAGREAENVLDLAYVNSYHQTGFKNLMDAAVLRHDQGATKGLELLYRKIDEIPFDFKRRCMSVVVDKDGRHLLICKGAVEEVLANCTHVELNGARTPLAKLHHDHKAELVNSMSAEGFRLIALAYREIGEIKRRYSPADEQGLTLLGFLAFLDPPKETSGQALAELEAYGVSIKILTGDNELVTRKICSEVGLKIKNILKGSEIDDLDDEALGRAAEGATVFDKLEPAQKRRVICALRERGHVVGFLGDGINDAPALEAADVGISVDGAVDIAKESSDIILLEKSLTVLKDGVLEGRRAFGNIVKYIKMTASSSFGNMASVVGGSIFLPFLPMLPLQVIANNLLYDLSQTSIPADGVDEEYLRTPRCWRIDHIQKFVLAIGPISSIFDYATYLLMLFIFNCWTNPALFHTGWFVESLLTQTLIVHIIRTRKIPFVQSRASWPLTLTTLAAVAIGIWLPFSRLAPVFGFVPLPTAYWAYIAAFLAAYLVLTQLVKNWFVKKWGWE